MLIQVFFERFEDGAVIQEVIETKEVDSTGMTGVEMELAANEFANSISLPESMEGIEPEVYIVEDNDTVWIRLEGPEGFFWDLLENHVTEE